jgi:hypothetical protein
MMHKHLINQHLFTKVNDFLLYKSLNNDYIETFYVINSGKIYHKILDGDGKIEGIYILSIPN